MIVASLTFLLGVAVATVWIINRSQTPRLVVPDAAWEPFLFRSIDERTAESGLPQLRTVLLHDDNLEVRVWVGFGQNGEDGLILRRSSGQWSALHLHGMFERYPPNKYQQILDAPKSGWQVAWQRLVEAGILILPDASAIRCSTNIKDGVSYVVEINTNKTYRTYMYDNPAHAKCEEAKRIIKLGEIISQEFGLEEFKVEG
jgi:hypothetical protein